MKTRCFYLFVAVLTCVFWLGCGSGEPAGNTDTSEKDTSKDVIKDTGQAKDTGTGEETEDTGTETGPCEPLDGVSFDGSCSTSLGFAVRNGSCIELTGCDAKGYHMFTDKQTCLDTCDPPEALCLETSGEWDANSCGGHLICGQEPECIVGLPFTSGCNCGRDKIFDDEKGCVDGGCTPAGCEDIGAPDFGAIFSVDLYAETACQGTLGWAVVYGSCQVVYGCPDKSYGFYDSREECNEACSTNQRLCMENGGLWMGDAVNVEAVDLPEEVNKCYQCGVESTDCTDQPPCNCGPQANWDATLGCVEDTTGCPALASCPDFDFETDYTPGCPAAFMQSVRVYGIHGDVGCTRILMGCEADFEGDDPRISKDKWFDSLAACQNACAERCWTDEECEGETGFCRFEYGSNCGLFTGGGVCAWTDGACIGFDPVCGCDGAYISHEVCADPQRRSMAYKGYCLTEFNL